MRVRFPQLRDPTWIRREYEANGRSSPDIALELGCSPALVQQALQRFDISRRGRHYGKWHSKTCKRCGKTFIPSGPAQLYCPTKECRFGYFTCTGCGTRILSSTWQAYNRGKGYCSRKCWFASRPKPRHINYYGYIVVYAPEMPGAPRDGRVLEHRLIAQQHLGRPLRADETVHHINGVKDDNRWDNLQVRSGRHGKGVVLACGDCGSYNIIHEAIAMTKPNDTVMIS